MNKLKLRAYAKLNLFLDITDRYDNGYHALKTVMQSISLYDELEFSTSEGSGTEIISNRSDLPLDDNNLVSKGIRKTLEYVNFKPDCKINVRLNKNIPSEAGMGGGSADCAASIVAADRLFNLKLTSDEMRKIGEKCGADVPFCIDGGTALCEGIGEKITALKPLSELFFVVVKPDISISTPVAYARFDEMGAYGNGCYIDFQNALAKNYLPALGKSLYNAFSEVCQINEVTEAKKALIHCGAFGAEMTGSGSAVFGIFDSKSAAENALRAIDLPFSGVFTPTGCGIEILK